MKLKGVSVPYRTVLVLVHEKRRAGDTREATCAPHERKLSRHMQRGIHFPREKRTSTVRFGLVLKSCAQKASSSFLLALMMSAGWMNVSAPIACEDPTMMIQRGELHRLRRTHDEFTRSQNKSRDQPCLTLTHSARRPERTKGER